MALRYRLMAAAVLNERAGTHDQGPYGGGTVQLWHRGYWIPEGDPHDGLTRGDRKFSLEGERLRGGWVLVRMKHDCAGGVGAPILQS